MDVKFRVVGLYFGSNPGDPPGKNNTGDITVHVDEDDTVLDVTQAAVAEANRGNIPAVSGASFSTVPMGGGHLLQSFSVTYEETPRDGRFEDGFNGLPETLTLRQDMDSSPMKIWQWYVYGRRPTDDPKNPDELVQKNTDNAFVPADQGGDDVKKCNIEEGDLVMWRLVSIQNEARVVLPDWFHQKIKDGLVEGIDPSVLEPTRETMLADRVQELARERLESRVDDSSGEGSSDDNGDD
jgi:hypothetical protein